MKSGPISLADLHRFVIEMNHQSRTKNFPIKLGTMDKGVRNEMQTCSTLILATQCMCGHGRM